MTSNRISWKTVCTNLMAGMPEDQLTRTRAFHLDNVRSIDLIPALANNEFERAESLQTVIAIDEYLHAIWEDCTPEG